MNDRARDRQKEHYDKVYQARDDVLSVPDDIKTYFVERFLDKAELRPGQKVLEIGCGDGILTGHLLDRRLFVVAIDISPVAVEKLEKRFPNPIQEGRLIGQSEDIMGFFAKDSRQFDAIVGSGIIHHISRDRWGQFFGGACQHLNAGGCFACGPEPHSDGLFALVWRMAGFVYRQLYHINYDAEVEKGTFDMKSALLTAALKQAGFREVELLPYQVLPHFSSPRIARVDRRLVERLDGRWALYTIVKAKKVRGKR